MATGPPPNSGQRVASIILGAPPASGAAAAIYMATGHILDKKRKPFSFTQVHEQTCYDIRIFQFGFSQYM